MQLNEKGTRQDLVLYRIETSKSDIKAAEILLEAKEFRGANNRAYYGIFYFTLQMKSEISNINYFVGVREKSLSFYGIIQMNADPKDEKLMGQMAEFVCRANHGLKNGCFDLNFENGEICYRSYLDCDGIIPSKNMVGNSIYCIATMYMAYAPAISEILYGDVTAKEAVEKCEEKRDV